MLTSANLVCSDLRRHHQCDDQTVNDQRFDQGHRDEHGGKELRRYFRLPGHALDGGVGDLPHGKGSGDGGWTMVSVGMNTKSIACIVLSPFLKARSA